jgi:hypothetical protein
MIDQMLTNNDSNSFIIYHIFIHRLKKYVWYKKAIVSTFRPFSLTYSIWSIKNVFNIRRFYNWSVTFDEKFIYILIWFNRTRCVHSFRLLQRLFLFLIITTILFSHLFQFICNLKTLQQIQVHKNQFLKSTDD